MLDDRSKTILKYLVKECNEGSYRVIEIGDLVNSLPKKYKPDETIVEICMDYLEKGNYISIKYKDSKMCCVAPLPFARQILENESNEKQKSRRILKIGALLYLLVFIFAFFGSFFAVLVYGLLV